MMMAQFFNCTLEVSTRIIWWGWDDFLARPTLSWVKALGTSLFDSQQGLHYELRPPDHLQSLGGIEFVWTRPSFEIAFPTQSTVDFLGSFLASVAFVLFVSMLVMA